MKISSHGGSAVIARRLIVCGPTPFVETAAASLVELGHEPERIKTERFGPTGET